MLSVEHSFYPTFIIVEQLVPRPCNATYRVFLCGKHLLTRGFIRELYKNHDCEHAVGIHESLDPPMYPRTVPGTFKADLSCVVVRPLVATCRDAYVAYVAWLQWVCQSVDKGHGLA